MNNIQFWIWVIVLVVTFVARQIKKNQTAQRNTPPAPSGPDPDKEESSRPLTFEELLREIQGSKAPQPLPAQPPTTKDYKTLPGKEAKSLEDINYKYPQPQRTNDQYEKAKAEAFARPSLEETMKLDDTIIRFGQFKGYQHDKLVSPAAEFIRELRSPSGFKKAFILSEILQRRF